MKRPAQFKDFPDRYEGFGGRWRHENKDECLLIAPNRAALKRIVEAGIGPRAIWKLKMCGWAKVVAIPPELRVREFPR